MHKRIAALALVVGALASLTMVGSASATNVPTKVYYRTGTSAECAAARNVHRLSRTSACQVRVTFGPVTMRTYRVTVPRRSFVYRTYRSDGSYYDTNGTSRGKVYTGTWKSGATVAMPTETTTATGCDPMVDPNCYNLPDPNKWYFVDSWHEAKGPGGLWQVVTYYHIKTNGYRIVQTANPTCETFAAGVTITVSSCGIDAGLAPKYEIGARWKECYVHPVLGFCHTKGQVMYLTPRGTYSYKSW